MPITPSEEQVLGIYLGDLSLLGAKNISFTSCLMSGLRDAREVTRRDINTGEKLQNQPHGSWLGAIGYMATLDQIGNCLKPKSKSILSVKSSIMKSLLYFTNLNQEEVNALYALRCAFAHDYSLYNINQNDLKKQHHFLVISSETEPIVNLPKVKWDGTFGNRNQSNTTIVNLEAFGDLVEEIYKDLKLKANNKDIEVTLSGGYKELIEKYCIWSNRF